MRKKAPLYKALAVNLQKKIQKRKSTVVFPIGEIVYKMRQEKHLSGVRLCEQAGNLDPKTLNALEKGRIKNPSMETLQLVARGLGVLVSDLFRHAEIDRDENFHRGTQKGVYQLEFPSWGLKVISFTPLTQDFFCGKFILGPHKKLDSLLLKHSAPIYAAVLIGRLEGTIEKKVFSLKEGENIFFNGNLNHTFYNPLERETVFLFVTAPSFL